MQVPVALLNPNKTPNTINRMARPPAAMLANAINTEATNHRITRSVVPILGFIQSTVVPNFCIFAITCVLLVQVAKSISVLHDNL